MGKTTLNALAFALVAPAWVAYALAAAGAGAPRVFPAASQLFSLLPGQFGLYLRRAFYRLVLPKCGKDTCISFLTVFMHPSICLGDHVYIGVGCVIGDVNVEDDVLIGSHVSVMNGGRQHDITRLDVPVRLQPGVLPRVTIGKDSWIGDRVVVMADVGRHCVVGAGAIVTKPAPDYAVLVGNPARIIQWRKEPHPRDVCAGDHSSRIDASASNGSISAVDVESIAPRVVDDVMEGRS